MKTLIYQYWTGTTPLYAKVSSQMFRAYAEQIGAEYRFDENPDFFSGRFGRYFNALRPIYDTDFHTYDRVLFVDMDVFPRAGLIRSIFSEACPGLAMAQEPHQPKLRRELPSRINATNDRRWSRIVRRLYGSDIGQTDEGDPLVFNSGVVLYAQGFLQSAAKALPSPRLYQLAMRAARLPRFYGLDQNYLQMVSGRAAVPFSELATEWNHQVHGVAHPIEGPSIYDARTGQTCFVHYQTRDRSSFSESALRATVAPPPAT